jgi:sec-independent protein translocase protein TatA
MEILVVLLIGLIVFGPKRIPELGQSLGKGIREFKASLEGSDEDSEPTAPGTGQEALAEVAGPSTPAGDKSPEAP